MSDQNRDEKSCFFTIVCIMVLRRERKGNEIMISLECTTSINIYQNIACPHDYYAQTNQLFDLLRPILRWILQHLCREFVHFNLRC